MSARVPLILGTANIGAPGKSGARIDNPEMAQAIVDVFLDAQYTELDTARIYGEGTTEEVGQAQSLFLGTVD
jgi:aflatoxin B1 aldehyde reductase